MAMAKTFTSVKLRSCSGMQIVEGVISMGLIISTVGIIILFLLNIGLYVLVKQKVAFCADQTAAYAALQFRKVSWEHVHYNKGGNSLASLQTASADYGCNLVRALNLPETTSVEVVYSDTLRSTALVTVKVQSNNVRLMGLEGKISGLASVQDVAVSCIPSDQPPAILYMYPVHDTTKIIAIPCYGRYTGNHLNGPGWSRPYKSHAYCPTCPLVWQATSGQPPQWNAVQLVK